MRPDPLLPRVSALQAREPDDEELQGWTTPMGPNQLRYDPIEGEPHRGYADVGVDEKGVWIEYHPELLLLGEDEVVQEVIDESRAFGVEARSVDELSAYERDVRIIAREAERRRRETEERSRGRT